MEMHLECGKRRKAPSVLVRRCDESDCKLWG